MRRVRNSSNVRIEPTPKHGDIRLLTLAHVDQRTMAARRARELIETMQIDLGGVENLTEASKQLVQRAACLGTFIESCEAEWLGGQKVDLPAYMSAVNVQRRVLATIGLERRSRDITPTLEQYAERLRRERAVHAEEASCAVSASPCGKRSKKRLY
jgi:hypothetical protein